MGQAKQRGAFEQRKAFAIEQNAQLDQALAVQKAEHIRPKGMTTQRLRVAMVACGIISDMRQVKQ